MTMTMTLCTAVHPARSAQRKGDMPGTAQLRIIHAPSATSSSVPEIALSSTIVLVPPGFPPGAAAADSGDALLTAPLSRLPALVDTRSS